MCMMKFMFMLILTLMFMLMFMLMLMLMLMFVFVFVFVFMFVFMFMSMSLLNAYDPFDFVSTSLVRVLLIHRIIICKMPNNLDPDPNVQEETGVDEDGEPVQQPKHKMPKRGGKFMEGVPGVRLFITQPKLSTIQKKVQKICEWSKGN